ncbi:MAG: hypothetical protein QXG40_07635 [Ignisphaera sp.]
MVRGDLEDLSQLVKDISSIYAIGVPGPIYALSMKAIPVVAGDEDTTPVPSIVVMASSLGSGRVIALGHEGFLTNEALELFDNKRFGNNVVDWLDKLGRKKILVTIGHREWYGGDNFNSFKSELERRGYNVVRFSGVISQSILSDVSVVLIGNAWGEFSLSEIAALREFVDSGGGLLLMGLGWSWEPYNPGKTLEDYPMNKIGELFGIRWIDGYIRDPTNNYNGQPIFHTFYPNIELQTIYQAFSSIQMITDAHPNNLPSILQSDASIRSKYVRANLLLATATNALSQDSAQRQEIYDFYKNLISNHRKYFGRSIVYDKLTQSVMAWLRERIYRSFIDALPLTLERKNEIALTIGLTDRYLDIWNNFTVLLLDNAGLNQRQKDFIYTYLNLIPKELHNLRAISVIDNLGVLPPGTPEIQLWGKDGGVNIFAFDIGAIQENGFPEDVPPKYSDVFCIVVAHEINHVVDAYYVSQDQYLRSRKEELIRRAGNTRMNYLRSMLPDGFFTSAPQEFFASIANQWFSDSALSLKLALARFDRGYKEPLNQFLFFAEVYSLGGNSTLFYSLDVQGNLQRREAPLRRDQKGRINVIIDGTKKYMFELDSEGNVLSYSVKEVVFHTVTIDVQPKVTGVKIDDAQYNCDRFPLSFQWEENSVHMLEIPKVIQQQPGVRYVFEKWDDNITSVRREIIISSSITLIARYRTEYLISAVSLYGSPSGVGWYRSGETVSLSIQRIIDHGNRTRRILLGWYKDDLLLSSKENCSITVIEPVLLKVKWRTEYFIEVLTNMGQASVAGWYDENTTITIDVSSLNATEKDGVRYLFTRWEGSGLGSYSGESPKISLTIRGPLEEKAIWRKQYYLTIKSNYGKIDGEGWHNEGKIVDFYITPTIIDFKNGTRVVFKEWIGDIRTSSQSASIIMDSPKTVTAIWKTQYYLEVASLHGTPLGGGWYDKDSIASISIESSVPTEDWMSSIGAKYVFIGWSGDIESPNSSITIVMDRPKKVSAIWKADYMMAYVILGVIFIILIVGVIVVLFSIRKRQILTKLS